MCNPGVLYGMDVVESNSVYALWAEGNQNAAGFEGLYGISGSLWTVLYVYRSATNIVALKY